MKLNNLYIYKTVGYDGENRAMYDKYIVSIKLENSKETKIEIKLEDNEQEKLFKALAEILPEKIESFCGDFSNAIKETYEKRKNK